MIIFDFVPIYWRFYLSVILITDLFVKENRFRLFLSQVALNNKKVENVL